MEGLVSGATYYLDASEGDDGGPGTSEQPWRTLARAMITFSGTAAKVAAGDRVLIRNGHYGPFVLTRFDLETFTGDLESPLPDNTAWTTYQAESGNDSVYFEYIKLSDEYQGPYLVAHVFDGIKVKDAPAEARYEPVYVESAVGLRFRNMHVEGNHNPNTMYDPETHATADTLYVKGGSYDVKIQNCDVSYGFKGITISGNNLEISDCNVWNTGDDRLNVGSGKNILIQGNHLHLPKVKFCEEAHPDLLQLGGVTENVTVRGNRFYDHSSQGLWCSTTAAFDHKNLLWENNLIYSTDNYEWTFYNLSGAIIRHNTIVSQKYRGIRFKDEVVNAQVYNNLFVGPYSADDATGLVYHDHNIAIHMTGIGNQPITNEEHSLYYETSAAEIDAKIAEVAAIMFGHPDDNDYRLIGGCPAIDFGTAARGYPPTDIDGRPRSDGRPDAGCFEYHGPIMNEIADVEVAAGEVVDLTLEANSHEERTITYSATGEPFDLGAVFSEQNFRWNTSGVPTKSYLVRCVASDGDEYASQTVSVTVLGDNLAPVLSSIGDKSATEEVRLGFSVNGTDGNGDDLSYSASGLPSSATFSGQSFDWTPATGQAGSYQVTFAVSDGVVSDSETITITVQSVASANTPPVLASIGTKSVNEAAYLGFSVSASDADGDSIAYSANDLPSGATFAGQSFRWTPTSAQVGSHQITFVASDGRSQDSETITVNVVSIGLDKAAPVVAERSPAADAIQVTQNHLVRLHVTDGGRGVDAETVVIQVNGQTIYQGGSETYTSPSGRCGRSGTKSDYQFVYQPYVPFDFDEVVTVSVNAADLEGNAMTPLSYSFVTEMRAFGNNWAVGTDVVAGKGNPATASNTAGDIWAAWHAGDENGRDIYVSRLDAGADGFASATRLTTSLLDQCNPDVAIGADGSIYVAWQDNERGNWDVFVSVSSDGETWSRPVQVTDSNDNEINPAIIVDSQSPNRVYVAWQDDRNGHSDIYVASSVSAFVNDTVSRVTTDAADQTDPDLAVDGRNVVTVVWTDMRAGQADLYAAASDNGPWANVPLVTASGNQTDAAVAVAPGGSVLHVVWSDDRPGNSDIYYARSEGLPESPLTGSTIIDDTSRTQQLMPAIACAGEDKAFACWQDFRHAVNGFDSDLFLTELRSGSAHTNVLIADDGTNANQSQPAMGIDAYGNPYLVWTDDRDATDEIYYAATTFVDPVPLDSKLVTNATGATVGPDPQYIDSAEDVSIIVPTGACQTDMQITIAEILNPQALPVECLGSFDLGPSGIEFNQPVTVTIPYHFAAAGNSAIPYWYDGLTGALSQQGITDIKNLVISSDLYALQFKTTHFTPFYLVVSDPAPAAAGGGGGGGGGCSVSATGNGAPQELLLPYAIVALTMAVLRRRDRKRRRSAPAAD